MFAATAGGAWAQPAGGSEWEAPSHDFSRSARSSSAGRGNQIEALDKILSASQLSPVDRSVYLSIRAFQLSRIGRQADSQKDVAEMGRLLPNVWQVVLSNTQTELAGGGDRAAALRTLDYGLQRKPGDPWLTVALAQVHMQIGDFPKALTLLDDALAGASNDQERRVAFFYRGHAHFNLGNYAQAADDFDGAMVGRASLKARVAPLLWRYAAQVHTRSDARGNLAGGVGKETLDDWPAQIAAFLLGRISGGQLEVAAESDDTAKRGNGKCPAAFFAGMDSVRRGDRQRAREQFQLAQARCPTVSELNWAASSELRKL
ncbi:MAG: tetratricopeptide repeat protein [Alphaproteobacteria bacterium]|nr:tetratricopeptide repeat protein [Alphaproteobacteria bacterium]